MSESCVRGDSSEKKKHLQQTRGLSFVCFKCCGAQWTCLSHNSVSRGMFHAGETERALHPHGVKLKALVTFSKTFHRSSPLTERLTNVMEFCTPDTACFQGQDEDDAGHSACQDFGFHVSPVILSGSLTTAERSTMRLQVSVRRLTADQNTTSLLFGHFRLMKG